jgi:RNA polymerase sigma-70 factor (ECF subfamily)
MRMNDPAPEQSMGRGTDGTAAARAALEEAVSQYETPLLRYVAQLLDRRTTHEAEDVVQEAFLRYFREVSRDGAPVRNVSTWLFRVAHNLALRTRLRARRDAQAPNPPEDVMIDPAPNPEHQFESAQRRQRLLAIFQALAEQDRRCLSLRAEGLRYREIAEVLDMSLGSVSVSLARSLARLTRAGER